MLMNLNQEVLGIMAALSQYLGYWQSNNSHEACICGTDVQNDEE